ncbi:hypothetical protein VP01_2137g5 [Puccinia sorghi]|uniref:2'-phosphotransferase n=1 Tax=Puccinia sorghi TaxID=27349 RepID=A0A0L6VAF4_9BASI|nr:hypothetical protein VP01_2137g5 [Puccinia sorghi]
MTERPTAESDDAPTSGPGSGPAQAEPSTGTINKPKKTRGRPDDSPDVNLSKTLSYILRHGALRESLALRDDGCVRLDQLLARPKLKRYTIDDIHRVVATNDKQRFSIIEEEQADGTVVKLIRANQGHSLSVKRLDLKPVDDPSDIPTAVHGTYLKFWDSIGNYHSISSDCAQEGLKPMTRAHIHFAKGLPGEEGVISETVSHHARCGCGLGMRSSSDVFIYLDVEKCFQGARADKIQFLISTNGVILSEGLPDSRTIPMVYFKKVVGKSGNILYSPSDRSQPDPRLDNVAGEVCLTVSRRSWGFGDRHAK